MRIPRVRALARLQSGGAPFGHEMVHPADRGLDVRGPPSLAPGRRRAACSTGGNGRRRPKTARGAIPARWAAERACKPPMSEATSGRLVTWKVLEAGPGANWMRQAFSFSASTVQHQTAGRAGNDGARRRKTPLGVGSAYEMVKPPYPHHHHPAAARDLPPAPLVNAATARDQHAQGNR